MLTINTSNTASNLNLGRDSLKQTASRGISTRAVQTGFALAGMLGMILAPGRNRRWGALLLLLCSITAVAGGCSAGIVDNTNNTDSGSSNPINGGGSSGSSGSGLTPYGTFLLNITTSSSDNTLRHTYGFPITVQ